MAVLVLHLMEVRSHRESRTSALQMNLGVAQYIGPVRPIGLRERQCRQSYREYSASLKKRITAAVKKSPQRDCPTHTKSCPGRRQRTEEIRGQGRHAEGRAGGIY